MKTFQRIETPVRDRVADGNILRHYKIEEADWVWLKESPAMEPCLVEFRVEFTLDNPVTTILHVSADQRFDLFWNDTLVGRGPDRSDLNHYAFASYEGTLAAGRQVVRALVPWWGSYAPVAQVSHAPGFILAAEGLEKFLNTGRATWQARVRTGIHLRRGMTGMYHVSGAGFDIDGQAFFADTPWKPVESILKLDSTLTGIVKSGPVLHPTHLPEQKSDFRFPAKLLSTLEGAGDAAWESVPPGKLDPYMGLVSGNSVDIPAGSHCHFLFDLDDYVCGYSEIEVENGSGSEMVVEWAESLFSDPAAFASTKGNRDEWEGKRFWGFGDSFLPDGPKRSFKSLWWRSGRYLRLTVKTGEHALRITRFGIDETGYPAEFTGRFACSDQSVNDLSGFMIRGLEACAHETFVDCPYYEQLCYVGDSRVQALCWLAMSPDDRLVRRVIELFDWSRSRTGYVAERYPSDPFQLCVTFSMIWVLMLEDYALWRNDPAFMKARLPGMRALLDQILENRNADGLLSKLPGWTFLDWIDEWSEGSPPGAREGASAGVDLFFLLALQAARKLEEAYGEPELAARWTRLAEQQASAILHHYWDPDQNLFVHLPKAEGSSETCLHLQCLAAIAGLLPLPEGRALMERAMQMEGLVWPTPYFQFYLFEALTRVGLGDRITGLLDLWRSFGQKGFKTPPEKEDPTRSDCHAWGSHPIYHLQASVAGIRPDAFGFSKMRIVPQPGSFTRLSSKIPHGDAFISVDLSFTNGGVKGEITLPQNLPGQLVWKDSTLELMGGMVNSVQID